MSINNSKAVDLVCEIEAKKNPLTADELARLEAYLNEGVRDTPVIDRAISVAVGWEIRLCLQILKIKKEAKDDAKHIIADFITDHKNRLEA